jgi:hypothetical protein
VKSTRTLAEWQRQSGKKLPWLATAEGEMYGLAFMAFCALQNAGFEPKWDDLLDVDTEEWEWIPEPSDATVEEVAPAGPPNSLADSAAAAAEGAPVAARPASKPSKKPKGGSKNK